MYLVDGSLPKNCNECPMRQINLARCQKNGRSTSHYPSGKPMDMTRRPRWCPIKAELPERHGDLVDADEAEEVYKTLIVEKIRKCVAAGYDTVLETAIMQIEKMNTVKLNVIVPAEGESYYGEDRKG